MNSQEFVIWLKGFTEGVHEYNVTPKQWDLLKEKLDQVTDQPKSNKTSGYLSASFITGSATTVSYPVNTTVTYTSTKEDKPTWYSINKIENDSGNK